MRSSFVAVPFRALLRAAAKLAAAVTLQARETRDTGRAMADDVVRTSRRKPPDDGRTRWQHMRDRMIGLAWLDEQPLRVRKLFFDNGKVESLMKKSRRNQVWMGMAVALQAFSVPVAVGGFALMPPHWGLGMRVLMGGLVPYAMYNTVAKRFDRRLRDRNQPVWNEIARVVTRRFHDQANAAAKKISMQRLIDSTTSGRDSQMLAHFLAHPDALRRMISENACRNIETATTTLGTLGFTLSFGWMVAPFMLSYVWYRNARLRREITRLRELNNEAQQPVVAHQELATSRATARGWASARGLGDEHVDKMSGRLTKAFDVALEALLPMTERGQRLQSQTVNSAVGAAAILILLRPIFNLSELRMLALSVYWSRDAFLQTIRVQDMLALSADLPVLGNKFQRLLDESENFERTWRGFKHLDPNRGVDVTVSGLRLATHDGVSPPVDLKLERGTVVALVGEIGAGKSRFLQAIGGALKPASGKIEWDGHPIDEYALDAIGKIVCYIPEWAEGQTDETIAILRERGVPENEIAQALFKSGLRMDLAEKIASGKTDISLSSGQRDVVRLLPLHFTHAALILVDEGGAHFDTTREGMLYQLLEVHARRKATVVAPAHSRAVINAGQIVVFDSTGNIGAAGPPHEVLLPAHGESIDDLARQAPQYAFAKKLTGEDLRFLYAQRTMAQRRAWQEEYGGSEKSRVYAATRAVGLRDSLRSTADRLALSPGDYRFGPTIHIHSLLVSPSGHDGETDSMMGPFACTLDGRRLNIVSGQRPGDAEAILAAVDGMPSNPDRIDGEWRESTSVVESDVTLSDICPPHTPAHLRQTTADLPAFMDHNKISGSQLRAILEDLGFFDIHASDVIKPNNERTQIARTMLDQVLGAYVSRPPLVTIPDLGRGVPAAGIPHLLRALSDAATTRELTIVASASAPHFFETLNTRRSLGPIQRGPQFVHILRVPAPFTVQGTFEIVYERIHRMRLRHFPGTDFQALLGEPRSPGPLAATTETSPGTIAGLPSRLDL